MFEKLKDKDFRKIVQLTPMVSVDLVIKVNNNYLFGYRINPPCQNTWCLPGGRIRKRENIHQAISRVLKDELSYELSEKDVYKLIKPMSHYYHDNWEGNTDYDTHYISLSYLLIPSNIIKTNMSQHEDWEWFTKSEVINNENIHKYFKEIINECDTIY